jgi:hypothetical protein
MMRAYFDLEMRISISSYIFSMSFPDLIFSRQLGMDSHL